MRSIRKSHVPTVSFRFERQIAEEGSRGATRATAPRRGLRVAALGNPYRSGDADHLKNTIIKQTETTAITSILCIKKISTGNCTPRIPKESPLLRILRNLP
ncbi:hypothetical protein RCS94_05790 [Orbaceae bacterium ac157xtp]